MSVIPWAFANIVNRPKIKQLFVRRSIKTVMDKAEDGFASGCELNPFRYDRAWKRWSRKIMGNGTKTFFRKSALGLAVHPRFVVQKTKKTRMHKGKALASPSRWWMEAFCIDSEDGTPVVAAVTHFVSGAHNDKAKLFKSWRVVRWFEHESGGSKRVHEAHDAGWNYLVWMDANRTTAPDLHPEQVVVAKHGLIMCIAIPAPGYRVKRHGGFAQKVKRLDHPMIYGATGFEKVEENGRNR
jgi:hypothetical protein